MSKVLIINDTSSEFHIGCLGVMKTIYDDIAVKWPSFSVSTVTTHQIKQAVGARQLLAGYELPEHVVVNGEGSMHENNREGALIIDIVQELSRRGAKNFVLLNTSIYTIPDDWLEALGLFSVIQVRDARSLETVSRRGMHCVFLPDRLFRFSLERYSSKELKKRNGVMYFDGVNRSHKNLMSIVGESKTPALYGAVDCSPFLTASILHRRWSVFSYNFLQVLRFYLKVIRRSFVYRSLGGSKYIYSLKHPVVTLDGAAVDVCAARYHIAVMCFSLCLDGKFLTSNTPKIEALIEYFEDTFPLIMEVNRCDDGFVSVSWAGGAPELVRSWVKSFDYVW